MTKAAERLLLFAKLALRAARISQHFDVCAKQCAVRHFVNHARSTAEPEGMQWVALWPLGRLRPITDDRQELHSGNAGYR